MSWNDPRLAWNVTSDNCALSTTVRASLNPELTNIWVPDLDLSNRVSGMHSFPEAVAKVYPDGTVTWKRSGTFNAFCSFIGLRKIPFHTLGCEFILSSESESEVVRINLIQTDNEEQRGIRFPNYKQTYAEYRISKERSRTRDLWSSFTIEMYFEHRATSYFISFIVIPAILFVFMSFGQFFFKPSSSDRVSFATSALFVVVANNIITSDSLPRCAERLWLNTLTSGSMYFVLISVFETLFLYWLHMDGKQHNSQLARSKRLASSPNIDGAHDAPAEPFGDELEKEGYWLSRIHELKMKLLQIVACLDSLAMFLFPLAYTLFLIIMFSILKNIDDDNESIWFSYNFLD